MGKTYLFFFIYFPLFFYDVVQNFKFRINGINLCLITNVNLKLFLPCLLERDEHISYSDEWISEFAYTVPVSYNGKKQIIFTLESKISLQSFDSCFSTVPWPDES